MTFVPRICALLMLVSACAHAPRAAPPHGAATVTVTTDDALPDNWKALVLPADATRLALIEASWNSALAEARARHRSTDIAAEGALLDPKAALLRPAPPPGRYRCRTVKLGLGRNGRGSGFVRFKPFYCFVATEGALLTFTKATGTQRPGGRLWDDGDTRMVFLGGVADGRGIPRPYSADAKHNLAGVVERVGDFRWRFVTPGQSSDARLEVIELVPDTPPPTEPAQ